MQSWMQFMIFNAVILLQIVMVSPGTHLVKSHKSNSRTNASPSSKSNESEIENVWAPQFSEIIKTYFFYFKAVSWEA